MLDEVGPWLDGAKARDLVRRLDHKSDPDQVIPAEYELAIAWGLSKIADFDFEPLIGTSRPDFIARDLFPDHHAVIEVAALSDDSLSGESAMERTANIINGFADSIRKKASKHLYYQFLETYGYEPQKLKPGQIWGFSQYYRRRLTSHKFGLDVRHKEQLRFWLSQWPPPQPLRLSGEGTEVVISWKERVHPKSRVFSSMPSLAYHLTDNPLFRRLKEKEAQIKDTPPGIMRCIFLGDAGCRLLREPNSRDPTNREVSGNSIILHFLQNSTVDFVAVFSPRQHFEGTANFHNNPRRWHLFMYDKVERDGTFYAKLEKLNELLPGPYLHGYQARSWMQQGMLNPQGRGHYRPMQFSSGASGLTVKISTRGLLELLAGRITPDEFHRTTAGKNYFENWLQRGYAISDATFIGGGSDEDDDQISLRFEVDPNASPFKAPPLKAAGHLLLLQQTSNRPGTSKIFGWQRTHRSPPEICSTDSA